jgi:protein involved in polysaccharide export with SLBB domain
MLRKPFSRAIAILLCVQPVFWMSSPVLAQTLRERAAQEQAGDFSAPTSERGDALRQPGDFSAPAPGAPARAVFPPAAQSGSEASRPDWPVSPVAPTAPPVDEPVDPDLYVCGPGDVLELNFWGVQNLKLRATIDLEGRAFVAKVGYVNLLGKTLSEARRITRESVARYFPGLSFGLGLAEPRTFIVQVVDGVARPASYPARAVDRIATLIGRAGGFGPNASKRRVEIRRRDGSVIRADLLLFTLTGDVRHNPHLLDGDVVRVPFEELVASIDGAVNRPGRYELVGSRDLAELLELAGGLATTATQGLPVLVARRGPEERLDQIQYPFTAEGQLPPVAIQNEDVVWIPRFAELQRSVTVVGAMAGVPAPDDASAVRRLPFTQGESVRSLLDRVGGIGPLADLEGSYVLRRGAALPVDLHTLVVLRDLRADLQLELGDALFVPFKRRNIIVVGAVSNPGSFQFNPSFSVEHYLSLAGGLNRSAQDLSEVYLVTPGGERKPFAKELKLEPGAKVVVPERNFSRAEVVQILFSAVGILLSGVAVVLAARK